MDIAQVSNNQGGIQTSAAAGPLASDPSAAGQPSGSSLLTSTSILGTKQATDKAQEMLGAIDGAKQSPQPITPVIPGQSTVDKATPAQRQPMPQIQPPANPVTDKSDVKGMTSVLDAFAKKGKISTEQLKAIKFESVTYNKPIEELLTEKAGIGEDDIQRLKAEMRGMGFVDLSSISIPQETLQAIPQDLAKTNWAVAFESTAVGLKVGMADPLDLQKIQFLESITKKKIEPYYASRSDITQVINTRYGAEIGREVDEALETVTDVYDVNASQTQNVGDKSEEAPVIRIVNMVLDYAGKHHASDIHIEPRENRIIVRYRIHGVLSEKLNIPRELASPVVARVKILANLKIDEHRIPQDGRFQIKVDARMIDIRVSVIPTVYGEKVVMRLLEKGGGIIDLGDTGLRGAAFKVFSAQLAKTQGIILVTGPTGSGKTQTLASSLKVINKPEVNIMTLEDPVEIRIDGINQVQVHSEVGLTFANGLRSFLRQDPDVIMVGEIRDAETAKLAIQASLTGHLVLATLHTNSAAGALPRLIDMGVEPYLLASTINVVMAQRLVRKMEPGTGQAYDADQAAMNKLHQVLDPLGDLDIRSGNSSIKFNQETKSVKLYRPTPSADSETGFTGRLGIFEVMTITEQIKSMLIDGKTETEIHKVAKKAGMITMREDGFIKALQGVTTLEEVLRVVN